MVKIRGILNARKMSVLAQDQGQRCIKSKLYFFYLVYVVLWRVFFVMSRNTSLWRHNDVFCDEKRVAVPGLRILRIFKIFILTSKINAS